uniref:Protein PsbN n=1 Tax=Pleurastrosarcina brevispinosa TaxID=163096 RepID=A0A097KN53_9CHLO|nr:N protein of photosystem II [Chlorosarcina brevispinosa]
MIKKLIKNNINNQKEKIIMDSPAFFYTIFLWCLLLSITGYSIYIGFGPPSKQLRDPFEEHED